jgi:uncharacterized Zn-finger protein
MKNVNKKIFSEFLESIAGVFVPQSVSATCTTCLDKINIFDEHFTVAMKVKQELCELLRLANETVFIKTEINANDESENDSRDACDSPFVPDATEVKTETIPVKEKAEMTSHVPKKKVKKPKRNSTQTKGKPGCKKMEGPQFYSCEFCNRVFDTLGKLNAHKQYHNKDRKFSCQICDKNFKTKPCRNQHMRVHDVKKELTCDYCGKVFLRKPTLTLHMFSVHTHQKNYLCAHCPKSFANSNTLRNHTLTHNEEKPFKCTTCGAGFHIKYKLERHIRSHSGAKNFTCELCPRQFRERYNLNAHMRAVHTDKKAAEKVEEFPCQICGNRFDRRGKLRQHLSKDHSVVNEDDEATSDSKI